MTTVAVSKLKASLSRFLKRVKAGDEIIVTERGKPVARIVPYVCEDDPEMARLREMERAGLLRIGTGKIPKDFWKLPRPKDPEGLALQYLLEERENGR